MAGPLEGVRVIEMGVWVAGPSCAAILADWGADVVKIEPPDGDPFRGLFAGLLDLPMNPPFELDNRGKRSIALNLEKDEARAIAQRLIDEADVFVSNMRPRVLEKYGLDYDACAARNPRLVYCNVSGYGIRSEDANRAAYDVGAFWSRAGLAASLTVGDNEPPQQRGGMGDHMTGANAAGAISAALYNREKTGKGQRVAVSLLRVGVYMMGWDANTVLRMGMPIVPYDRHHAVNPIINSFQDRDGKWFWLLLLQADRHWPDLLRALDAIWLNDDPRFSSIPARTANIDALYTILGERMRTRSTAEWRARLDAADVPNGVVNDMQAVVADPGLNDSGFFHRYEHPSEGPCVTMRHPVEFSETPASFSLPPPRLGEHTEAILSGLGYSPEEIAEFAT